MIGVGVALGFAFLAKMMEAFLVVPGFALVYLIAAPVGARRRVTDLLAGGLALIAASGWWLAIVALWPAGSRPMIDGSPDNNIFNLIFQLQRHRPPERQGHRWWRWCELQWRSRNLPALLQLISAGRPGLRCAWPWR